LIKMMKATGIANDIGGVGYGEADVEALDQGCLGATAPADQPAARNRSRTTCANFFAAG
jgi:hypothetical protein